MALDRKPCVGEWIWWPGSAPHRIIKSKDNGIVLMRSPDGNTYFFYFSMPGNTFDKRASFCTPPGDA